MPPGCAVSNLLQGWREPCTTFTTKSKGRGGKRLNKLQGRSEPRTSLTDTSNVNAVIDCLRHANLAPPPQRTQPHASMQRASSYIGVRNWPSRCNKLKISQGCTTSNLLQGWCEPCTHLLVVAVSLGNFEAGTSTSPSRRENRKKR